MPQNTSERRIIDNIRQQLRLLEEAGIPKYITGNIQPVFLANDDIVDNVQVRSAERTTSGTSTIFTTDSTGTTWLTHICLSMEASTAV